MKKKNKSCEAAVKTWNLNVALLYILLGLIVTGLWIGYMWMLIEVTNIASAQAKDLSAYLSVISFFISAAIAIATIAFIKKEYDKRKM